MLTPERFEIAPGGCLRGSVRVPGDKSISHRSVVMGAIAEGRTSVQGFLEGEDCLATIRAFRAMGVEIGGPHDGTVELEGVGMHGLQPPTEPIDLGNSGTSMRLLAGLLAAQPFDSELGGDKSLCARPMRRVTDPLQRMGAAIDTTASGTAPLRIHGRSLRAIDYAMPVASAQVKSCLLLAGLYAQGQTCVTEPGPSRDHTERMLQGFGYRLERAPAGRVCLTGGGQLQAARIEVPADISSAAFLIVGASIAEGSDLVLEHVGVNPTRDGILTILEQMGARIEVHNRRLVGGEPIADLRVQSAELHGIRIPEALVPLAIDEFPALFVAAACAQGETVLSGAAELRVKESDRIEVMAAGLQALGIEATATPEGMIVRGGVIDGGEVDSAGDHRIAMALAMAGLVAHNTVQVHNCAAVATSFPGFDRLARQAGLRIGSFD